MSEELSLTPCKPRASDLIDHANFGSVHRKSSDVRFKAQSRKPDRTLLMEFSFTPSHDPAVAVHIAESFRNGVAALIPGMR